MTLRRKILLGFGIALCLVLLVLTWAVINLVRLGSASDSILRENYKSIIAAEVMINAIERQDSAALLLTLGFTEEADSQFSAFEVEFLESLARAADNITVEGEAGIIARIDSVYQRYLQAFDELSDLAGSSTTATAAGYYHETVLPLFTEIRNACESLRDLNQSTAYAASAHASGVARRAIWSTLVVGLAAVAVGLVFSLLMSTSLTRPLQALLGATARLADRDYSTQVPVASDDELGRLAAGFNQMAARLHAYDEMNLKEVLLQKRRIETVIENIEDGILVVDRDLRIVNLNGAAAGVFGVERQLALGRHFLETARDGRLFSLLRETVESGAAPELEPDTAILSVGAGEERRYFTFAVSPVEGVSGGSVAGSGDTAGSGPVASVTGAVLLLRDVTRLKELDRLKSEFVMTASHELRTPLAGLEMSVELLREKAGDRLTGQEQELLEAAHSDVLRLKALVSDLLDLSRIEAGRIQLEMGEVDLRDVVEQVSGIFQPQFAEKRARLRGELSADLPPVRADAEKVAWVLSNLISNALRYISEGGAVTLGAERSGNVLNVSVADDGAGIPYQYQSRIFDKFVQVAGDSRPGRTGLGLAISREIVRAHGGTIWVESVPGEGSRFTFTLPLARGEEA